MAGGGREVEAGGAPWWEGGGGGPLQGSLHLSDRHPALSLGRPRGDTDIMGYLRLVSLVKLFWILKLRWRA